MNDEAVNLILSKLDVMQGDINILKSDVSGLKHDVSGLKSDVSELKQDVSELKQNVSNLNEEVCVIKQRLDSIEVKLKETNELAEFNRETSESIKNVVTSHYMEFKKFVKSNSTQHNLYNAKLLQYNKES